MEYPKSKKESLLFEIIECGSNQNTGTQTNKNKFNIRRYFIVMRSSIHQLNNL